MKIEGKSINLRKVTRSDAQSIYEHAKDREISRYTFIPHPYKREDALHFIKFTHRQMKKEKEYHLGIELKTTGQIIGMIGMMQISQKHRRAEVGYWLGRSHWGKGYAAEALHLMLRYGFKELKLVRIWARVMHPNLASARMLEKIGFTFEGRLRKSLMQNGRWLDELRYGILKEEFSRK
jgi:RimJ/RimL family protein N-acetyltransferase